MSIFDGVWNFKDLFLPYWRLIWHLNGEAVVDYSRKETRLSAGKQIIISPHTPLTCHSAEAIRQLFVYFTIDDVVGMSSTGIVELPQHPGIEKLVQRILVRTRKKDLEKDNTYGLIATLCQLALSDLPDSMFVDRRIVDERISRAMALLGSDYNKKIKIGTVAACSGLSVKSLERKFTEILGISPIQYRQKLKVEKACSLLHFTDFNIDVIAEQLGYSDRYHFTKSFIRQKGISPGRYRKGISEFRRQTPDPEHDE